jgi:hypothetical protein
MGQQRFLKTLDLRHGELAVQHGLLPEEKITGTAAS